MSEADSPTLIVEVAFATDPLSTTPSWSALEEDITVHLREVVERQLSEIKADRDRIAAIITTRGAG